MMAKLGLSDVMGDPGDDDTPASVDYRLAREATLFAWRSGELSESQICDAQRELRRNAHHCGEPVDAPCPVCAAESLVDVTYVFGPRLPAHGRCVSHPAELGRLARRRGRFTAYVVEVCVACGWNHLSRSQVLGTA
ncbi:MAG: hypothetical protein D6683_07975 [Actinomyces sp.]|nr:MAG: hypothetical protein D6683_07975 [Actinomyces sp.]